MDKGDDGMPGSELQILQGQPAHLGQCVAQAPTALMHQERGQRDRTIPGQHSSTQPTNRPLPLSGQTAPPWLTGAPVSIRTWTEKSTGSLSPPVFPLREPGSAPALGAFPAYPGIWPDTQHGPPHVLSARPLLRDVLSATLQRTDCRTILPREQCTNSCRRPVHTYCLLPERARLWHRSLSDRRTGQ